MIVLNEKDADRIASHLRKRLGDVEKKMGFAELFHKNFCVTQDFSSEDSKELEMANNEILMEYKAQRAEIAELLVLLMEGSGEGVEK